MLYMPSVDDLQARSSRQMALHARAAEAARPVFDRKVFVRGVVEVSNFCRENCHYCGMRRDNRALARRRAHFQELAELLLDGRPPAVTDISFQAGEDPIAGWEVVLPLAELLQRETKLGLSACLGTHDPKLYHALREAGCSVYIVKFETGNPATYARVEAPGSLDERLKAIHSLAASGWKVCSGFIAGLPGQDLTDLVEDCRMANQLPLHGCSVSPFVPGEATPCAAAAPGDIETTLNCMALLRLMRPDWIIPAVSALNVAQPELGYRRGLRAGANLVTINLTPGTLQRDYVIYKRERFIVDQERALAALEAEGLTPSPVSLAEFLGKRPMATTQS